MDSLGVWVMTTRSEKLRRMALRGFMFLWVYAPSSILISNRPASGSTNGQPKGVAAADDGTIFVITTNGAEVYAGGSVGKKVADLPLKTNPNCIAVHGKTVAVGAEVSPPSPSWYPYPSHLYLLPRTRSFICILGTAHH